MYNFNCIFFIFQSKSFVFNRYHQQFGSVWSGGQVAGVLFRTESVQWPLCSCRLQPTELAPLLPYSPTGRHPNRIHRAGTLFECTRLFAMQIKGEFRIFSRGRVFESFPVRFLGLNFSSSAITQNHHFWQRF